MGVIAWLIVGLIAGFLASMAVNRSGKGILRDIVLGIIGALVGGFIFHAAGYPGVTGLNGWSILVAFIGAVVVLIIYHALIQRPGQEA
jgi:uncharacterized membrane protein YeaQ/YmgE (transglycosylase-associated protein family)